MPAAATAGWHWWEEPWRRAGQQSKRSHRRSRKGSIFRGVSRTWDGRWQAEIKEGGVVRPLGLFDGEEAAARAYDAEKLRLGCAVPSCAAGCRHLNFPPSRGADFFPRGGAADPSGGGGALASGVGAGRWLCEYCGRALTNAGAKSSHERWCKKQQLQRKQRQRPPSLPLPQRRGDGARGEGQTAAEIKALQQRYKDTHQGRPPTGPFARNPAWLRGMIEGEPRQRDIGEMRSRHKPL